MSVLWYHQPKVNTFTSRERRFTAEMIKEKPVKYEITDRITKAKARGSEKECKRWAEEAVKSEVDWNTTGGLS